MVLCRILHGSVFYWIYSRGAQRIANGDEIARAHKTDYTDTLPTVTI